MLVAVSGKDLKYVRGLIMGTPGTFVVLAIQAPGSSRISTIKLQRRAATALSVQPQAPPSLRHQHLDLSKSLRQTPDQEDLKLVLSPTAASSVKPKQSTERPKSFISSTTSLSSASVHSATTSSNGSGARDGARDDLERVVEQRARAMVQVTASCRRTLVL